MGWRQNRNAWRKQTGWEPLDSPTARAAAATAAAPAGDSRLVLGGGRTKAPAYVCVGRQFARHPDRALRKLAQAQARATHNLNDYIAHGVIHSGPCPGRRCLSARRLPWNISLDAQLAQQASGELRGEVL